MKRYSFGLPASILWALVSCPIVSVGTARALPLNDLSTYALTGDGAWKYSSSSPFYPQPEGESATYFPTTPSPPDTYYHHRIVPNPTLSAVTQGDSWIGTVEPATYQVFTTYAESDRGQIVPLAMNGDDGHSLFIDDQFVGGGGFGQVVSYNLPFTTGQRHKISVVGYNGPAAWAYSLGVPYSPLPENNPQFITGLNGVPGIRISADGNFRQPALTSQVENLDNTLLDVLRPQGVFGAYASSFTTDDAAYTLSDITLAAHTPLTSTEVARAEVRIREDVGGRPGLLVANLGFQALAPGGPPTVTYRSSGVTLAPNHKYWVTVGERVSGDFQWSATNESQVFSPSGWLIGDQIAYSSNEDWQTCNTSCYGVDHVSGVFQVHAERSTPSQFGMQIGSVQHTQTQDDLGQFVTVDNIINQFQGGGALGAFDMNFDNTNQAVFHLSTPEGYRFVVNSPAGKVAHFDAYFNWETGAHSGQDTTYSLPSTTAVEFTGVFGNPAVTYTYGNVSDLNEYVTAMAQGQFTGDLRFTGIDIKVTYENRMTGKGQLHYSPISGSALRFSVEGDESQFVHLVRIGDLNLDGSVDAADAGQMFAVWGSGDSTADVNGDHIVDAADAGELFRWWTGDSSPSASLVPEPSCTSFVRFLPATLLVVRRIGWRISARGVAGKRR